MIAIAAAILPAMSSLFSDIFGITTPLIMSCEIDDDITNNKPAAVDNAAAIPPAATKAMTQFGKPAISGLASTIMSLSTFNSLPCQPYSMLVQYNLGFDHYKTEFGHRYFYLQTQPVQSFPISSSSRVDQYI